MGNTISSDKSENDERRDARFSDTHELTIVLVSDAETIRPDDSRKLRGNVSQEDALKLLHNEKSKSSLFDNAWNKGVSILKNKGMITSTSDYNSCLKIAVCCYTIEIPKFYDDFNTRCRTLTTENWNSFPYKSMWIMLTDAIFSPVIKSNPPVNGGSFKAFRGLMFQIPKNQIPKVGDMVHSKQFMSTSVNQDVAKNFVGVTGTLIEFVGKPEAGKGIKDYSQFPGEGEVLFAPWEMFKVISVDTSKNLHKIVLQA